MILHTDGLIVLVKLRDLLTLSIVSPYPFRLVCLHYLYMRIADWSVC
jgi:hypothetical protein